MKRLKKIAFENNLCAWIVFCDRYVQGTSGYALHAERKWRSLLFVPRYFDLNVRQMSGSKLSLTKFQTLEKMFFYCDLDYIYVALTYVRQQFDFSTLKSYLNIFSLFDILQAVNRVIL